VATRAKTIVPLQTLGDDVRVVTWTGLLNGDDGDPFEMPGWAVRSVQVSGTLGAAGAVTIEGSNNGANYLALTDPQGNALAINSLRIEAIAELTRWIRPRVTAGDGTTNLTVTLLAKRQLG
jgi:hypothetical protein